MKESKSNAEYDHHSLMTKLGDINKDLQDLQEEITRKTVRAHILQIDLATQIDPHMLQCIKKTVQSCEKCKTSCEDNALAVNIDQQK